MKGKAMSDSKSLVPIWVRGVTGLLAIANIGYGVLGYVQPGEMFSALDITAPGALDALHQFAARNTAIGLALMIVALVGVPETIAILMIVRFLIEGQDLVLGLMSSAATPMLVMAAAFMVVEATVIVLMFRIVSKRDAAGRV
jgi:hypothetical protein